jgi:hypothetical protein
MRLNAHIQALLALALLWLGPASLAAAKRAAHRTPAHKAAVPVATKKHARKRSADTASTSRALHNKHHRGAKKLPAIDSPDPITIGRTHSTSRRKEPSTETQPKASAPDIAALSTSLHRKATAQDFLDAAGVSDSEKAQADGTRVAKADDSMVSPAIAPTDVARPTAVVSVARALAAKPQLEEVSEEAATPVILPTLYNKRGRLIVPRPLKGSHEILVRQNLVADRDGLDRIQDDNDLANMRDQHLLIALPAGRALEVDDRLPADRRYCRPWTAQFLAALARAHYARFHTPLQVNSAVRTVEFQQRLLRTNGNAAPAEGETASPHLTGQAIDLAKHGLSLTEIAWLRGYLLPLVQQGRIDVEEEFQQSCFHISVYKKYMPSTPAPHREITPHHASATALATAIR